MSEPLELTAVLNTPALPVANQPRMVYLLLQVSGGHGDAALPVNLVLVIDTSESMHIRLADDEQFRDLARMGALKEVLVDGVPAWEPTEMAAQALDHLPRKIDRVKDALRVAVELLRPSDQFAMVAFATRAETLIPNTSAAHKVRLLDAIAGLERLRLGDATYMAAGMALGFDEVQRSVAAGLVDRMLVLTDGFAFDEAECRAWAQRARQAHLPISTIGLGGEFNEELMIPIADQTGGEAYLLEVQDLAVVLSRELQRAQAVRYRNLELKLRPTPGVEVRAAYRVRPAIAPLEMNDQDGSYSFPLGELVGGEEPGLLLELVVPPHPAGSLRLAQLLLAYDDPAGGTSGKVRADVVAEVTDDLARAAQTTPQVMRVVEALSAYRLQRNAQNDLAVGNVAGATRKLRAAATRLLDMGEPELAAEVQQQASALEQHGQADPHLTKKLRYETRKLGNV